MGFKPSKSKVLRNRGASAAQGKVDQSINGSDQAAFLGSHDNVDGNSLRHLINRLQRIRREANQ